MNFMTKLLTGAAAGGLLLAAFSTEAVAQTPPAPDSQTDGDEVVVEEVVITGSRIRRTGADTPTPTTIIGSEVIEQSGVSEIADLGRRLISAEPQP